jgi:DNA repair photolyase
MKIREINVKSVITKSNLPEADFVINPYIGCQHSCVYCYADFMKRFTGHAGEEWGGFVDVKINASETISSKKIPEGALILFGSVTDPYQPIESKYKITRSCLEKLLEFQPKLEILTKSPLVLRDIDLLKQFKHLRVGISIGVLDEKLSHEIEPYVASPKKRVDTLKELSDAGIETYLFVSPIFPEISDINGLLDSVKSCVGEVIFENLNIRANNRERIMNFITKNKPELKGLYSNLQKDRTYWNRLKEEIIEECEKREIKYKTFFNHGKRS